MIDMVKYNAVPPALGPPVVVGTCSCGGEITKQFLRSGVALGLTVHSWNVTCTKGGDACLQPEKVQP